MGTTTDSLIIKISYKKATAKNYEQTCYGPRISSARLFRLAGSSVALLGKPPIVYLGLFLVFVAARTREGCSKMARLNKLDDSGDELPDITDLLPNARECSKSSLGKQTGCTTPASPVRTATQSRKQRPLKIAPVNILLLPLAKKSSDCSLDAQTYKNAENRIPEQLNELSPLEEESDDQKDAGRKGSRLRSRPRKVAKAPTDHNAFALVQKRELVSDSESSSKDYLSDFIVDDSCSELELPPTRSSVKIPRTSHKNNTSPKRASRSKESSVVIDLTSPEKLTRRAARPQTPPQESLKGHITESLGHLRT